MDAIQTCFSCQNNILPSYYFCPNCGRKLKEKSLSTSIGKQLIVYFISFIFSPFGLWYGVKYLKQNETKAKLVGVTSILLTIIALVLMFWTANNFINSFNKELNKQLQLYPELNY